MTKKFAALLLLLAFAASAFVACSRGGEKVMEIPPLSDVSFGDVSFGDVSVGDVSFEKDESSAGAAFFCGENSVDEALFRYVYLFLKKNNLANWRYLESGGSGPTGDKNIAVGDTEAFWNSKMSEEKDGTVVTFGDYLYDSVCDLMKKLLAVEAVVRDCGLALPEDYAAKLEKAIYSDVARNGSAYLGEDMSFADGNGVVYDWVRDRRKMHLAGSGISDEDWERVFFRYPTISEKLQESLEAAGVLKPKSDDEIIEMLRADFEASVEGYVKEAVKFDFLCYEFRREVSAETSGEVSAEASGEESAEASEEVSAETSEEVSAEASEEVSAEASGEESAEDIPIDEYNKQLSGKCEKILDGLKDGSLDYEDEAKKADGSEVDYLWPKAELVRIFGDDVKDCAPGDFVLLKDDYFIYILHFEEVSKSDFKPPADPDEDQLVGYRKQSVAEAFDGLLKKYRDAVETNEALLEKYKRPWEIVD